MRPAARVGPATVACLLMMGLGLPAPARSQEQAAGTIDSSALKERAGKTITALAAAARQLKLDRSAEDLELSADRMEFDYQSGRLTYSGRVRLKHGSALLKAAEMVFDLEPGGRDPLRSASASGGVELTRNDETASGHRAFYNHAAGTITLEGDARLGSDSDSLLGERVIVHLSEGRTVVEGGDSPVRVRLGDEME